MFDEKDMRGWWLDGFFARHDITFNNLKDKNNFKKYYIYHKFNKPTFPIKDNEYRPEFRQIRFFIDNREPTVPL